MRLANNDYLKLDVNGRSQIMRIASINSAGRLTLAGHTEANVDARNRDSAGEFRYTYKQAGSLQLARAKHITVNPIGDTGDFKVKD